MEFWIDFNEKKPPVGLEVMAKCDEWIDEDYNKLGVRIGFLDEDDDGPFISAKWDNVQGYYEKATDTPSCWRYKTIEDNPSYEDEIRKAYIDSIRDSVPSSIYSELNEVGESDGSLKSMTDEERKKYKVGVIPEVTEYLELNKFKNPPVHFYNSYIRKPGEPELTEEDYMHMVGMARNPLKFRNPSHVERPFTPDECFAPPEPLVLKVGGKLYCNSGRRNSDNDTSEYKITSIGKKYIYAEGVNYRVTRKIPKDSLSCDMHDGTGYRQFFLSKQELLDHNEHARLVSKIVGNINYNTLQKLSLNGLRGISEILELNKISGILKL